MWETDRHPHEKRPCGEIEYHNSLLKSYSGFESRQGYFLLQSF